MSFLGSTVQDERIFLHTHTHGMGRPKSKNVVSTDMVPLVVQVNPVKFKRALSKRNKGMLDTINAQAAASNEPQTLEMAIFTKISGIFSEFNAMGNFEHGCTFLTSRTLQSIYYSPDTCMLSQRAQFSKGLDHPNTSVALFWGLVPCYIVMKGYNKTQIWMHSIEAFQRHRAQIWNSVGQCFSLSAFYDLPRNFENNDDWVVFNESILKNTFLATVFTHACFVLQLLTKGDMPQYMPDSPAPENPSVIDLAVLDMIHTCCLACVKLISDIGVNVFQGAAAALKMEPDKYSNFIQKKLSEMMQYAAVRRNLHTAPSLPILPTLPLARIEEEFEANFFSNDQILVSSASTPSFDGFRF
jgi:hypothetical protein